jgi:hypothetical protein
MINHILNQLGISTYNNLQMNYNNTMNTYILNFTTSLGYIWDTNNPIISTLNRMRRDKIIFEYDIEMEWSSDINNVNNKLTIYTLQSMELEFKNPKGFNFNYNVKKFDFK